MYQKLLAFPNNTKYINNNDHINSHSHLSAYYMPSTVLAFCMDSLIFTTILLFPLQVKTLKRRKVQ